MTAQPVPSQAPVPNKASTTRRFILLMATSLMLGAGAGYPIGRLLKSSSAPHPSLWSIPLLIVAALMALAVHEAGHVFAGLLSGFRFHLFIAGPLRIQREGDRITFGFNRIASLWGGIAACTPLTFGPELRGQMLRYVAGGPLFSLVGGLALWPAFALRNSAPTLASCFAGFGLISAMLCLATLVPIQLGGYVSDGGRILMLLRKRAESQRWIALASLAGLSLAERPRNWPPQLVEMLGDSQDGSPDSPFSGLLRHLWHVDLNEGEAARFWLDRCLSTVECVAAPLRPGIYSAAAYFHARRMNDAVAARAWFDKAEGPGVHQKSDLHIVRAAVLIAEGRPSEAAPELDLALAVLASKPASAAEPLLEDIAEMRAVIR